MKKSIFLSFASVAMLLASCSSEESFKVPFVPGNSEVEISLSSGAPSLTTRAAIENNDAIEGMGVYCVAKSSNNEGETVSSWNINTNEDPAHIMNNVKANKASGAETTECDVTWADESARFFYPAFLKYNYDFYAYYPHSEEAKINEAGDKISVDYTIDGETDIIWGNATSDEKYAYNANYFREPGNNKKNPNLKLDHMLTRLIFRVEQVEAEAGEAVIPMKLEDIELIGIPTNCTLNIADKANTPKENRLTLAGEDKTDLVLKSDFLPCDTKVENGKLQGKYVDMGSSFMIYPQESFTLRLTMTQYKEENSEEPGTPDVNPDEPTEPENPDVNPDEPVEENPGEEVVPDPSNAPEYVPVKTDVRDIEIKPVDTSLFEAGKAYIVTIKVNGPRKIEITATLTPWKEVDNLPVIEF